MLAGKKKGGRERARSRLESLGALSFPLFDTFSGSVVLVTRLEALSMRPNRPLEIRMASSCEWRKKKKKKEKALLPATMTTTTWEEMAILLAPPAPTLVQALSPILPFCAQR